MRRAPALTVLLLLLSTGAMAQQSDARDEAIDLATITVAHELCSFDLSDAEEDAIAKRRQALVDGGAITASELGDIDSELSASMKRQVAEGLCKPGGAEAKLYRRMLDALVGH